MKDKNHDKGTALMCSLLGCNTGMQKVPGVSKDCWPFILTKDKYLRSIHDDIQEYNLIFHDKTAVQYTW